MRIYFSILIFLVTQMAEARLQRFGFDGVRQSGMGNTGIALADDANTLWYNPAGLADVSGIHVNLFDFVVGADSTDTLTRLNNAFFKSDFQNLIRPDKEFLRFGINPQVVLPFFSFSLYENLQGYFDLGNIKEMDFNKDVQAVGFNDLGAIAGFAIPFGEYFSLGASARVFQRTGIESYLTTAEFINQAGVSGNVDEITSNLYQYMKNMAGAGVGVGTNAGALFKIPLRGKDAPTVKFGATVDDIGNTSFTKLGDVVGAPASIRQSVNLGAAIQWKPKKGLTWNNELNYRDALEQSDYLRHVHFGSELRWSWLGIRGGVSQGYATFGFSLETPPHTRIHFSTYGVEVGNKAMEKQHRWYLVQLIIGFNPF